MEMNGKQQGLVSHHLSCLSGSSQAPLIPSANEPGSSERSTPISAHSLAFNSPTTTSKSNQHQHQHQQTIGTPLAPLHSASLAAQTSVFFPPLPARASNQQMAAPKAQLQTPHQPDSQQASNKSPKSADFNMNVIHERNRETMVGTSNSAASISSNHQIRFIPTGSSSRLNSPSLSMSAKSASPGFFPPESHIFAQQQQTRRALVVSTGGTNNNSISADDNYHLYHEPIDPNEPSPLQVSPSTANFNSTSNGQFQSFVERPVRNDVSADIYHCYVTLKSNERINQRSRSYHGPKNPNSINSTNNNQVQNLPYHRDAIKNLSSTSVSDLPLSPAAFASAMIPIHFRDHCVRELIETESNYVHALEMIISCFSKPLETLLKREDNQLIFGYIKHFHHIHVNFQAELVKSALRSYNKDIANLSLPTRNSANPNSQQQGATQANSNPSTPTIPNNVPQQFLGPSPLSSPIAQDQCISLPTTSTNMNSINNSNNSNGSSLKISSCFLNVKDKFLKYGEYCATLTKAQTLLDELTNKNDAIAVQLDRCQQDANEGKFKLRDLLSLPMQRILKYHLLLAQLIKNTSATNDDYHGLKRAHEAMVDLGQYINEVKRDTEAIQIINDIEQSITGLNMPANTQLTDYGRLVTDGFIRIKVPNDTKAKPAHDTKLKLSHDTKMKQKRIYVFVFDKVMLMCKVIGVSRYQYKEALVLSEYEIDINPTPAPNETLSKHAVKEKWSYNFNLVRSNDKTVYSFYAKTAEFKARWIESIHKAMDNIRPAACRNNETNHEFLMHTFEKASSCDHCGKLLLGLYYQGYRCRTCFTSAHKKCLAAIRPCGPTLPPRPSNTLSHSFRGRGQEPPSPSVRSDDGHVFMHFPASKSSSTQCVDVLVKNEYSNIDNRAETMVNQSTRTTISTQRPVSSMINVSLQNSTNHLLQQRRLLKGGNALQVESENSLNEMSLRDDEAGNSYVNFILNDYPWFCGRMERDKAQSLLESMRHGTFLVRVSPKHNGSYVISLNYNSQVKHMRIYVSKDNQLYLSQNRYFKSVIELVSWYEQNSLVESFHMLDARLTHPYKTN